MNYNKMMVARLEDSYYNPPDLEEEDEEVVRKKLEKEIWEAAFTIQNACDKIGDCEVCSYYDKEDGCAFRNPQKWDF